MKIRARVLPVNVNDLYSLAAAKDYVATAVNTPVFKNFKSTEKIGVIDSAKIVEDKYVEIEATIEDAVAEDVKKGKLGAIYKIEITAIGAGTCGSTSFEGASLEEIVTEITPATIEETQRANNVDIPSCVGCSDCITIESTPELLEINKPVVDVPVEEVK